MAKIEKGHPLPSHTKLKYDECHAKILLEKFFRRYITTCKSQIDLI